MIKRFGISGIIFIAIIILRLSIWILNYFHVYLQFQYQFNPLLNMIIIIAGLRFALKKVRDSLIKRLVIGLAILCTYTTIAGWWLLHSDDNYIYFTSPDKNEKFVIIENAHSELYQISRYGMFIFHLTNINGNNGYRMFSDKKFFIRWIEPNQFTVIYVNDYTNPNQFKEVTVTYTNYK